MRSLEKQLLKLYHKMTELDRTQRLLVANWQRNYFQLSDALINSLVGLTVIDTLDILAQARKEKIWSKSITP